LMHQGFRTLHRHRDHLRYMEAEGAPPYRAS
jgi:hypothetical protein